MAEEGQLGIAEELHVELVDSSAPDASERAIYLPVSEPRRLIVWIDDAGNILSKQYVTYNG